MQFAYKRRKNSDPTVYQPASARSQWLRSDRVRPLAILAIGVFALIFLFSKIFGGGESETQEVIPAGTPPVVLVTVFDLDRSKEIRSKVQKNREQYAKLHGYATFFPNTTTYDLATSPKSWSRVPAMRHAMTAYPHSTYFFFLDENSIITNHDIDLQADIMARKRLEDLMITNHPVVPPDSVIKTFAHLKGDRIDLVLTQDREGLAHQSFVVRRGEWAKYFLDAWFDPLYRSYNFQKAEQHALEHLVQWHGTILAKLALIPQNVINAYADAIKGDASEAGAARDGDFVTTFGACDRAPRDCLSEMRPYFEKATEQYDRSK